MTLVGRRDCRNGQCHPRTLAEAVHCLLLHATKDGHAVPVEALAGELAGRGIHLTPKRLYRYADATPGRPDTAVDVPLRVIDAIEAFTGSRVVTRYRAQHLGGAYIDLPRVHAAHVDIRQAFLRAAKKFGDSAGAIETALADQHIDVREAETVGQELRAHVEATLAVLAMVEQKVFAETASGVRRPLVIGGTR